MKYSEEDIKEWDELYDYVRYKVMGYDLTMKLSKYMILRLKELRHGTMMANQYQDMKYAYTYKEVLLAFKFSKPIIDKAFSHKSFDNENLKFGYALAIARDNINEIKLINKRKEETDKKIKSIKLNSEEIKESNYKKKNKKVSDRLKKIW